MYVGSSFDGGNHDDDGDDDSKREHEKRKSTKYLESEILFWCHYCSSFNIL